MGSGDYKKKSSRASLSPAKIVIAVVGFVAFVTAIVRVVSSVAAKHEIHGGDGVGGRGITAPDDEGGLGRKGSPPAAANRVESERELEARVARLTEDVRALRARGAIMDEDVDAISATVMLQAACQQLVRARYAHLARKQAGLRGDRTTFLVDMALRFPAMMPDLVDDGTAAAAGGTLEGTVQIETAPIELMPYAVYVFLEMVRNWKGGAFHRRAGHVVQAMVERAQPGSKLAFQEYNPEYPHVQGTLGFAGRPGGPAFYISTVNNTRNHGPASQGSGHEADSCFGKVAGGQDVVQRLHKVWGIAPLFDNDGKNGFIKSKTQWVTIKSINIRDPGSD